MSTKFPRRHPTGPALVKRLLGLVGRAIGDLEDKYDARDARRAAAQARAQAAEPGAAKTYPRPRPLR